MGEMSLEQLVSFKHNFLTNGLTFGGLRCSAGVNSSCTRDSNMKYTCHNLSADQKILAR